MQFRAQLALALRRDIAAIGLQPRFARIMLVILAMGEVDGPHIDLPQPGRDRPHFRRHARRQAFGQPRQPLIHLLPGEVDVGGIGEDGGDLGKAVAAQRATIF